MVNERPFQTINETDTVSLQLLTRVLGLWFRAPEWVLEHTDEGAPYVHLFDASGDLSVIISRDETGEYATESYGSWVVPNMTGSSLAALAFGLAGHYTAQWSGIAHLAKRLMREARPRLSVAV